MRRHRLILFVLSLIYCCFAFADQVTVITVTSVGFGTNEPDATQNAIINAVAQVNGESIASSMRMSKSTVSSTEDKTKSARSIQSNVEDKTKGVVKSWKKISAAQVDNSTQIKLQVQVLALQKSDQLKRIKLAVVPSGITPDNQLNNDLATALASSLTSTRKFAVMDRNNVTAVSAQLEHIKANPGSIEDLARISAEVAPDYIAVVNVKPVTSDKQTVLEANLDVIDYATRQVKFSDKKKTTLINQDRVSISKKIDLLAKNLSRIVIETVYPPLVIGQDEDGLTISQGSDFFNVGDKCVVKEKKGTLKDPYTKEFLGYETVNIANAEIIYTDKRLSKAKLTQPTELDLEKIADKKYQILREGQTIGDLMKQTTLEVPASFSDKNQPKDDDY